MNKPQHSENFNWRKYFWLGLVLLVAGYSYGQPTLQKWTGLNLPSLNSEESTRQEKQNNRSDYQANSIPATTQQTKPDSATSNSGAFKLKKLGRNKLVSPAGLIYTMGPRGEHRVDHIMRHAKDSPGRPVHSVFEGDRNTILKILDEGYELIKKRSSSVKSSREGNRTIYTIDMKKKIGYEGGQSGKRKKFPALKNLKLILQDENYVVTAFPFR